MKRIALILGMLLGIFLVIVIVLEFVLDLNSYKGQVTEPLAKSLNRNVTIGEMTHTLLRGPGAAIRDVTISNVGTSEAFVRIKSIIARIKLFPLLSKKIAVSKIVVDEPIVLITRNQEGGWNIDDLLGREAEAAPLPETEEQDTEELPEPPAPQSPVAPESTEQSPQPSQPPAQPASGLSQLAIDSFRVADGTVRIVDELLDVTTEFTAIEGNVRGVAVDSPINFQFSTELAEGTQGTIKASGTIGPIPSDGNTENLDVDVSATLSQVDVEHFTPYYQVAQLQQDRPPIGTLDATLKFAGNLGDDVASAGKVSVGDVSVEVEGHVKDVQSGPKLDLTISSKELPWEKLIQLLPPDIAKPLEDLGLSGLGTLTLQPKGAIDNLAVAGEFDLSQSGLAYQSLFAKPEALPMTLKFDMLFQGDSLTVSTCQLVVGKVVLDIAGTVINFQEPELDLTLSSNAFPLAELLERFPEVATLKQDDSGEMALQAEGLSQLYVTAKGAIDDLAVQMKLDVDKGAVAYANMFQKTENIPGNFVAEARVGTNAVSIQKAVLNLGDFQLNVSGDIVDFASPNLDVHIETNTFDIGALFEHFPVMAEQYLPPELTLEGPGKLRLTSSGTLDNLGLSGSIDMSGGKVAFGEYFAKPKDIPGAIEFDTVLTKDAVDIRRFQLHLNGVVLDISGNISDLSQRPMLDLSLSSNRFAFNQLMPVEGMEMMPTGTTEFQVAIRSPLEQLDVTSLTSATCHLVDVGFLAPGLKTPVKALHASLELQGQTLTIQNLTGRLGESSLAGTLEIARVFSRPDIVFSLRSENLNIDEFLEQTEAQATLSHERSPFLMVTDTKTVPQPTSQSPPQDSQRSLNDVWSLPNLSGHGMLTVDQGVAKNIHFSDLTTDIVMAEQVLTIENMLFSLYDGRYEGGGQLDLSSADPKYAFQSKLIGVNTNRVLSDGVPLTDVLYGLLFANASVQGQGFQTEQLIQTLSGNGDIKINDGYFANFDIWSQLADIFSLLGSVGNVDVLTQMGQDFTQLSEETHFSRLEGNFELQAGKAGSSDIILEIPEQDMHMTLLLDGEMGLDTTLDFLGTIRFASQSKYHKDLKKYFHDFLQDDGSIELPFPIPIGGTLLEPEMSLQSVQKSVLKFAGEMAKQSIKSQLKKSVESELEKAGKSLLKDLFK